MFEATAIKGEVIELMNSASYDLRKWSSNVPEFISDLSHCEQPRNFDAQIKQFLEPT